jgi:CheY-like chemotaxis protein
LFDIILMDIQMPVMGGVQATEIIRQGQYQKDIPIVALTANAFKDELDKYKGYGMNDCLSKPFNSDELYNKILELTGRVGCQVAIGNQINEDVPLYDLKKLGSMLGNNNDLILKMVQSFLKHTPPLLEELYSAAEDSNWNQVSKICHRLKASYKTMSIDSLESPIHLLEIETSSIPDNDRQKYLTSIRTVSSKVFEKLNKENFQ